MPRPVEETYEFRSKEGTLAVFLSWQPKERVKALGMARVYDLSLSLPDLLSEQLNERCRSKAIDN